MLSISPIYSVLTFLDWLLVETQRQQLPPEVLQSYETVFQQELERVIQRTQNPILRVELEDMRRCPIRDSRGNCQGFASYIAGALIRSGIGDQYDLPACLNYVIEKMLLTKSDTGEPKESLFRGFQDALITSKAIHWQHDSGNSWLSPSAISERTECPGCRTLSSVPKGL